MKLLNPSLSCLLAVLAFVPVVVLAILAFIFRAIRAFVGEEDGKPKRVSLDYHEEQLAGELEMQRWRNRRRRQSM